MIVGEEALHLLECRRRWRRDVLDSRRRRRWRRRRFASAQRVRFRAVPVVLEHFLVQGARATGTAGAVVHGLLLDEVACSARKAVGGVVRGELHARPGSLDNGVDVGLSGVLLLAEFVEWLLPDGPVL